MREEEAIRGIVRIGVRITELVMLSMIPDPHPQAVLEKRMKT